MIHIFLGTKAQLIKMAPVMVELQNRGIPYNFVFSGQHQATVDNIREDFGVKEPDTTLYQGNDITGIVQMAFWCIKLAAFTLRNRSKVWRGDKGGVVLVHGDTFSTLLGALLARLCGHRCAHVESGLRSFSLFNPFPEELTRLATFRLSSIYFAPGSWAINNLSKYKGKKIDTTYNTLLDSLRICEQSIAVADVEVPQGSFAVVSLHRFENTFSRARLEQITALLGKVSERIPLLFILHKPTRKKLSEFGLLDTLKSNANIELRPRYSYFQFIRLVKAAAVILTDGGSNQEECYYLGKPCVILRSTSERQEGLGGNAVISNYQLSVIEQVLTNLEAYRKPAKNWQVSPSQQIVETLMELQVPKAQIANSCERSRPTQS